VRGDYRIGDWLIHPRINSMEKDGETVHFEPKVMQVLLALASEPGEVVTRERLRTTVWPDVFVGEDVLIRAISELRRAFSDDPREPAVIQTVPKVGYRLITSVSLVEQETRNGTPIAHAAHEPDVQAPESTAATNETAPVSPGAQPTAAPTAHLNLKLLWGVLSFLVLGGVIWAVLASRPDRTAAHVVGTYASRPLTTYPGSELQPSFSPDGSAVAFVWLKEGERYGHIYVKLLGSEAPSRLTAGIAEELSPTWSPDGRWIAFIRHDETQSSVHVIPAIGGSEQEIYKLPTNHVWDYGGLAWTPDGKALVFPQQANPQAASKLVEVTINGRIVRSLTSPPEGWNGDWTPAVSPDGTKLAFVRGPEGSVYDIYVMRLPDGKPQRITNDNRLIVGLTWSADGSSIIFSSNRSGSISLWRVLAQGGIPDHEPAGGDNAYSPSVARQGNRLVYSHGSATWSILAADLNGKGSEAEADILTSSEQDASPHVSPAGDKIAFQSWRSGAQEIWTSKVDGSDPVQLTSLSASAGSPFWSHDGRHIAFDARPDSFAHIYVIDADGGSPRAITHGSYNDIVPSWSVDDRWIFFGSNRSGTWQVWKIPSDGSGAAQQVTTAGGMVGIESADGQWLYFTHYGEPGLWRCPVNGGPEKKIFDGPPTGNLNYWTLSDNYLYSLAERDGRFTLQRVDPETGRSQTVYTLKHDPTPFAGISLTPNHKRVIFAELDRAASGLTLVEHFE
jgi:Tol biopolymer transport system component/DNA-binding winged helix-turn-helix (wHTH) protein